MKEFIISTLSGNKGRFVTVATAVSVGLVTRWFARNSWTLDENSELLLSTTVGSFTAWLIDSVILQINRTNIKEIQDALPPSVQSDGYAGPKTIEAVKDAVQNSTVEPS